MCAVAVLEAKFVNIAERSPVDVGKIPLQRFRLVRITCAASVVSPFRIGRVLLISSNPSYLGISLQTELYNLLDSVYGRWQLFLLPFFKIFPCSSICLFTWRSSKRVFSMWQVTCLFFSSLVFNLLSWLLLSTEMLQDVWGIPVVGEGLQQESNCT